MLRGFTTTLAIVSAVMLGAWTYADQSRVAIAGDVITAGISASPEADAPAAAKGDKLFVGARIDAVFDQTGYGIHPEARIIQAHSIVAEEVATHRYLTIAKDGGKNETVLVRTQVD